VEKPLVVILGPTGSGKSQLAIDVCLEAGGEVVNYDSVQLYRGFDIGAAKIPPEQRCGVRHHLLDVAGPGRDFTAGEYAREARRVLAIVSGRGRVPVLCGGTGFYLRALLAGLSPAPPRSDGLRRRLERIAQRRPRSLHFLLSRFDSAAARHIHPNDLQKLIRAIEMAHVERSKTSDIQSRPRTPLTGYRVLKIGLDPDRQLLYSALNARTEALFANGLLEETRKLLAQGYSAHSKPMLSLGYRQAVAVLNGAMPLAEGIEECRTKTRQYAKRQLTWFRAEEVVKWFKGFGVDRDVCEQVIALVTNFLREARVDRRVC
jgi:tRNA dimethylallyltransferase